MIPRVSEEFYLHIIKFFLSSISWLLILLYLIGLRDNLIFSAREFISLYSTYNIESAQRFWSSWYSNFQG